MMKCVLIVTNFNAGRKKAVKYKKAVIDFVLKYTKFFKFADIDELKTIDITPYDTILAMGGDGTVNKVLPYLVNTDKVLGIIPCGTANLLAAKLGLPLNLKQNFKIIEKNNIKTIDILDINNNLCTLRCGFGYDADIICKTPQTLKNRFGYFAYFIAGILFGFRLKKKKYKMIIDGEKHKIKASCVIFSNAANMYKNIVSLDKNSVLDDGIMEVFILKTENPIRFFFEFLSIIFNLRIKTQKSEYLKAKSVQIDNSWIVCHIDGEKRTIKENIDINIKHKAIKVIGK